MPTNRTDETRPSAVAEPITDHESLREHPEVPFHEEADRVDGETVDAIADLDDMAIVGVTNDDGAVLFMRITEDCDLKPPSASVAPEEDFAAAARQWVESQAGFPVSLETVEGVWEFEARSEETNRTATRAFVVFRASPASDDVPSADAEAAEVRWADELPEVAAEPPGIRLFFD